MKMNEYQRAAARTIPPLVDVNWASKVQNGVMGLCGESGECIDIVKKWLWQGHELDREKLMDELGDVLWYIAETASGLGYTLGEIAQHNVDKLLRRYPDGFSAERSINRMPERQESGLTEDE